MTVVVRANSLIHVVVAEHEQDVWALFAGRLSAHYVAERQSKESGCQPE
jgi:hypothetical protein